MDKHNRLKERTDLTFREYLIIALAGNSACFWLNTLLDHPKDSSTLKANSENIIRQADAIIKQLKGLK